MKKVTVLGCGLVGGVIARDLAADPRIAVTAVDRLEANLANLASLPNVTVRVADLGSSAVVSEVIREADVVVGAVPGFMGYKTLEAAIAAGKPVADIAFSPEDPLALDEAAKSRGVTLVVDAGVSPGLSNLAIGRAASKLAHVREATIYVGGLPVPRHWPFEYRSVFSPTDVVEEYTRPARLVEAGRVVVRDALTEVELLDFPGVGTLEAFNTDGLRTLIQTVRADYMKEKTLRYPGHADRMRMLREMGLFSSDAIEIDGAKVVPRRLTEKLMFSMWKRPAHEEELTVLRVVVEGDTQEGTPQRFTYDLLDRTDFATGASSMARTTGFPCAIVARMLASGRYVAPGVHPLEHLGARDELYQQLADGLRDRNVQFSERVES